MQQKFVWFKIVSTINNYCFRYTFYRNRKKKHKAMENDDVY